MMYWGNHMGTGDWIFSILGTLIILGLIVGLIVWVISPSSHASDGRATDESAREILDRRLASGEITRQEYNDLREALSDTPSSASDSRPRDPAGAPG
jgi:uncharacterized membrane protein